MNFLEDEFCKGHNQKKKSQIKKRNKQESERLNKNFNSDKDNIFKRWIDFTFKTRYITLLDRRGIIIDIISIFNWQDYKIFGKYVSIESFLNYKLTSILKRYNLDSNHFIELTNYICMVNRSYQNGENDIYYSPKKCVEEYIKNINYRIFENDDIKICKILFRDFYFV